MIPNLNSPRRGFSLAALAACTLAMLANCTTVSTDSPATPMPAQAGRELAQRECASCHAIGELGGRRAGALGEDPNGPPPLREVLDHYSPNRLRMAFQEGMIVGHMDMPVYRLSDQETDELLAYLRSIRG